jgi:hypothetical protein
MKRTFIYLLPDYANSAHLVNQRYETEDTYTIGYNKNGLTVTLTETNSLIEEEYCLNLYSAKYIVEGGNTVSKESMIHHHEKGHTIRHLQFILKAQNKKIRIMLDFLDDADYERCIKGFLHISQDLILKEQIDHKIGDDLVAYFFNDRIKTLSSDRAFLLSKIGRAHTDGQMMDDTNSAISKEELIELKKETHLSPFLDW